MSNLNAPSGKLQSWSWDSAATIFALIFLLSLTVRLLVLWQVKADPRIDRLSGDGRAYLEWAAHIRGGAWIGRDVFYQTPLYPYFVAVVQSVTGDNLGGLRIIQALIGAAGFGVLAIAARQLFGPAAACWAGALIALHPASVSFDLQIDKPVLDTPLIALLLWCVAAAMTMPTWWRWGLAGVVCGVAALTRENVLVFAPVLAAAIIIGLRQQPRKVVAGWLAALIGGAIVALLPVSVRNSLVSGEFHITSSQSGANFYIGNSAEADGLYQPLRADRGDAQFERIDATELAEADAGKKLSAGEVSRYWTRRAGQDIAHDPWRWIKLMGRKLAMVFAHTELADADVHDRFIVYSSILRAMDRIWGFGPLLVLAGLGVALSAQRRSVYLVSAMSLAYALSVAMFYVFGRYRLPLVPLLAPLAGAGVVGAYRCRVSSALALWRPAIAIALTSGLIWAGELAIPARARGTNEYNRAMGFAGRGAWAQAESYYRRALSRNPEFAAAKTNLGLLLADDGRLPEAQSWLEEALRLESRDATAHVNVGMVLARQKRYSEAIEQFRSALSLDPSSTLARYNLGAALLYNGQREQGLAVLKEIAAADSSDEFARRAATLLRETAGPTSR